MAYPSLSPTVAKQRVASIEKVYVVNGAETAHQYLGLHRNGELKVTPFSTEDTRKRNLPVNSYLVEAKFELLQTEVLEIEKIDALCDGTNGWIFKLSDAEAISTDAAKEGWFALSDSIADNGTYQALGSKAKYVCDGNPSGVQYIEVMVRGIIASGALDSAFKPSLQTSDFHISSTADGVYSTNNGSAGGTIFGNYLSTSADDTRGIQGNVNSCGFSKVELQDANSTTYTEIGKVRNGRITYEVMAEEDNLGRFNSHSGQIDIEYELMLTDAATLLLFDTMNTTETDVKITLLDGKVFTIASKLGINVSYENVGDFNGYRILRFKHAGRILLTEFDGLVA